MGEDWKQAAACQGADTEAFYREGRRVSDALWYCRRCPVTAECLSYALEHEVEFLRFGVWGGTSARQRARHR